MNTSEQLVVNKLPTRTWNHLQVNEATIPWNVADTADLGTDSYAITAENQAQPLHIDLTGAAGFSRKHIAVDVAAGVQATAYMVLDTQGSFAVETAFKLHDAASLRLVQVLGAQDGALLYAKTDADCAPGAGVDMTQILMGRKTQLFTNRVMTFMMPGMMMIMYCITLLIVWVAAKRIDGGYMQVGSMTAFITYTMMIVMAFLMLTMMSIMMPRAGVAAERIDEVVRTKSTITDPKEPVAMEQCEGVIAFHHVNFRYPGATEDVLSDIDFVAEPGKTTAIIGSTGCGKSTLVNLLPRFYDVTGGEITLDGTDIRNYTLQDLREHIGFVPQKGILFSGTIASNLRFGAEDASDEQIREAAEIAQATEFIDSKQDGYESAIAQGGSNVSGGQKQRLAIARAIAKNPKIYVFDDSFSALDMKTDAALRRALETKTEHTTVIIVAQRISTILHADQILVLDDGKIVGKGTHEELLHNCEVYEQIARSQLSAKELGLSEEVK